MQPHLVVPAHIRVQELSSLISAIERPPFSAPLGHQGLDRSLRFPIGPWMLYLGEPLGNAIRILQ